MPHRLGALLSVAILLLPTLLVSPARAATITAFSVTEIPLLSVQAMNDVGQFVGLRRSDAKPVIWHEGKPEVALAPLDPLPTSLSDVRFLGTYINNAGTVVGSASGVNYQGQQVRLPIIWENALPRALATPYALDTDTFAINDLDQITGRGQSYNPDGTAEENYYHFLI